MANKSDTDDYDPHEHREPLHPTSNIETLVHIVRGSVGTGVLAMPEAFKGGGLIPSTIGCVGMGAFYTYCLHILINAQYILCKRKKVPMFVYSDSVREALLIGPDVLQKFAKTLGIITDGFLILYQIGVCCIYHMFVAEHTMQFLDRFDYKFNLEIHMSILVVPLIFINLIRNLKLLVPLSHIANACMIVGFGIIGFYMVTDFDEKPERTLLGSPLGIPMFLGTALFAFNAIALVISLENNMHTPKAFLKTCGILNIGMGLIIILYVTIGFLGYWRYGNEILPSVTLNLPNEVLANVARGLYALAIFLSHPLQLYVAIELIWTYVGPKLENSKHQLSWEIMLRILLILVNLVLAVAIPHLGLFISLIGTFPAFLAISLPALMEICVKWPEDLGSHRWIMWKDILITVVGITVLILGIGKTLHEIITTSDKYGYPYV